jgi:hypothetical protein
MKVVPLVAACLACLTLLSTWLACHADADEKKSPAKKPVKLYGQIDELSYLSSGSGISLTSGKLPARVAKISLGSTAAYSGLKEGDTVTDAEVGPNSIDLTVKRNGKSYRASIATNVAGLKADFKRRNIPLTYASSAFDKELEALGKCKIVVMIDRCESMGEINAGVPGDLTKWAWCQQQVDNMYIGTERVLNKGFDIVLFNDKLERRNRVNLFDLKQVFQRIKPEGTQKRLSAALDSVLQDYFKSKDRGKEPLVVAVLTDGGNVGIPLQQVLIEASKQATKPYEVNIIVLQVGTSFHGEDLFEDLDTNLVAKGAKYHILEYHTFAAVRNKGLLLELVTLVSRVLRNAPTSQLAGHR